MAFTKIASLIQSTPNGITFTTNGINTSGANLITVLVSHLSGVSSTLSDNHGNTYTGLTAQDQGLITRLYYVYNPTTSASHTFTVSALGSFYPTVAVIAWSGAAATPFDQQNGATDVSNPSPASGSITPSENDELIVTGAGDSGSGYSAVSSPFSIEASVNPGGNNYALAIAYEIQTAATARNATWTNASSVYSQVVIASFKAAGAPAGGLFLPPNLALGLGGPFFRNPLQ